jgi:hypothetical protein
MVPARRTGWLVMAAVLVAGCGDDQPYDAVCGARRERPGLELGLPFCERLSTYRFFDLQGAQRPAQGVIPYDITTPLFADHALKDRFLWLPPGTAMSWNEPAAFGFPIGAVIIKTFSFPVDQRQPERGRQLIETRLLVHRERGWEGVSYLYDGEGEGRLAAEGAEVDLAWTDVAGAVRRQLYLVPNKNQCKNCHEETEGMIAPLGPKARHLHRPGVEGSGVTDQLVFFRDSGLLLVVAPKTRSTDPWISGRGPGSISRALTVTTRMGRRGRRGWIYRFRRCRRRWACARRRWRRGAVRRGGGLILFRVGPRSRS